MTPHSLVSTLSTTKSYIGKTRIHRERQHDHSRIVFRLRLVEAVMTRMQSTNSNVNDFCREYEERHDVMSTKIYNIIGGSTNVIYSVYHTFNRPIPTL